MLTCGGSSAILLKYMVAIPAATLGAMKVLCAPTEWLTRLLLLSKGVAHRDRPSVWEAGLECPALPPTGMWLCLLASVINAVWDASDRADGCMDISVWASLCPRDRQLLPWTVLPCDLSFNHSCE